MEDKRKCIVSGRIEAYFIKFGTQIIYDDANNPLQRTSAIVEAIDGRILEVEPSQIKFIE